MILPQESSKGHEQSVDMASPRISHVLKTSRIARLATVDSTSAPFLVPICYAYDGKRLYTPLDAKPKRVPGTQLKRVRNIKENPKVAVVIDEYGEDWSQLYYVLILGIASLIAAASPDHVAVLKLLRRKYAQYRQMPLEENPVISINPMRIRAWGTIPIV